MRKRVGLIVPITRELAVYTALGGNIALDSKDATRKVGGAQKLLGNIPAGTQVRIGGLASRLIPRGRIFYYACRSKDPRFKFDIDSGYAFHPAEDQLLLFPPDPKPSRISKPGRLSSGDKH
jgi:hypothetical protein